MIVIAFPILLLLVIGGVALTLTGWRGRRIDDHPLCRRCRFDLTGLPTGSAKCSECGADLAKPRAIRHGHRRKRPVMLTAGVAMLLLVAAMVATAGIAAVRQVGVDRLKPTWLLVREARDPRNIAAWTELSRRVGGGSVSSDAAATLTERVLARQGDANRAWKFEWGDFVEAARDARLVDDLRWQKYARQAPQLALELRAQVRKGDDLPCYIRSANPRVGNRSRFRIRLTNEDHAGELTVPQRRNRGSGYSELGLGRGGSSAIGHTVTLDDPACRAAAEGERAVRVSVDCAVFDGAGGEGATPLNTWRQDLDGKWSLVAADAETVKVVTDESLRPAVEKALTVPRVIHQRWGKQEQLRVDLRCEKSPVPLAYEAFARDPATGREWKLSAVTLHGTGSIHSGVNGTVKDFNLTTINLVLRPSAAAARNTITVTRLWDGEVVMKDLPVTKDASWDSK